jgi:hypothetical protein
MESYHQTELLSASNKFATAFTKQLGYERRAMTAFWMT